MNKILLVLALMVAAVGCTAPYNKTVQHDPQFKYHEYLTPRGVRLYTPDYISKRPTLLGLALMEVDNASVRQLAPGWAVRILPPMEPEGLHEGEIQVQWRTYDHMPHHVMLPSLRRLALEVAYPGISKIKEGVPR